MSYELLKVLHVLSACLLFGTGLTTASYMYLANKSKNLELIASTFKMIVKGDWYFTVPSGFMQLVTGFLMVYVHHLSLGKFWLWASLVGYLIAAFCWFPVVYLQIQLRDLAIEALQKGQELPRSYYLKFKYWFLLGWPAFISLIIVFYLMVNKPSHFLIF